jgi:hypothetical protein
MVSSTWEIIFSKEEAPFEVLDAWFQFSPDPPKLDTDPTARLGPDMELNGQVIHNNAWLDGVTGEAIDELAGQSGLILLQDHGDPVSFRNFWIVSLPLRASERNHSVYRFRRQTFITNRRTAIRS